MYATPSSGESSPCSRASLTAEALLIGLPPASGSSSSVSGSSCSSKSWLSSSGSMRLGAAVFLRAIGASWGDVAVASLPSLTCWVMQAIRRLEQTELRFVRLPTPDHLLAEAINRLHGLGHPDRHRRCFHGF